MSVVSNNHIELADPTIPIPEQSTEIKTTNDENITSTSSTTSSSTTTTTTTITPSTTTSSSEQPIPSAVDKDNTSISDSITKVTPRHHSMVTVPVNIVSLKPDKHRVKRLSTKISSPTNRVRTTLEQDSVCVSKMSIIAYLNPEVANYPARLKLLNDFLVSEFSKENLDFVLTCREIWYRGLDYYKKEGRVTEPRLEPNLKCPEFLREDVLQLINTYVRPGSPKQVNLASTSSRELLNLVDDDEPDCWPAELLHDVHHEILFLISRDSFQRFIRLPMFEKICREEASQRNRTNTKGRARALTHNRAASISICADVAIDSGPNALKSDQLGGGLSRTLSVNQWPSPSEHKHTQKKHQNAWPSPQEVEEEKINQTNQSKPGVGCCEAFMIMLKGSSGKSNQVKPL